MSHPACVSDGDLRIVHILRSPTGGLFRHVLDLADAQIARGHRVGVIADSMTGGRHADETLSALAPRLALGLARLPMRRDPHPADALALLRVARLLRTTRPDVVHGHGAKGALYARLPGATPFRGRRPVRIYTPHGGSLHYDPRSLKGAAVLRMEQWLGRRTDMILFESGYAAERYRAAVGAPPCPVRIVHNGLRPAEFEPIAPRADAADILYVGELRMLKGVDVLLMALPLLGRSLGRAPRAVIVGSGPDREPFEAMATALGDKAVVDFRGPMPARDAFALGRVLVVPSRAESLPYVVLEAAAARIPLIASRVGGIPEIVGAAADTLVPPGDAEALAGALARRLAMPADQRAAAAGALSRLVETGFSVDRMADDIVAGYRDALAADGNQADRQPMRPALPLRPVGP